MHLVNHNQLAIVIEPSQDSHRIITEIGMAIDYFTLHDEERKVEMLVPLDKYVA